ncbi:hypothetical protein CANCADRAFT_130320 [Tortispora caseinolytica NRRL Y-17796]|uniref:Alkaline phytoceramidase n=1 Tax=Tortispora caseinolytica NRRL Y-17796 TaxID=767744 RepID=A0A1E4TAQ9_9ASCO|nr:hypothetical protein CANCADRAFT_130320 [Tortispora caseinolytica NRRL Y-17796]
MISFPYADLPHSGFWGHGTATIDWCEENYIVSHYVAEFTNTLTNLGFVALAVYATYNAFAADLEWRFIFTAIGFGLVGIGSWMFHMTLWYEFQLLDELPMIYATCIPTWTVLSYRKSRSSSLFIAFVTCMGAGLLTAIYLKYKDPTIHQIAYALLNCIVLIRSMYLIESEVKDPAERKKMWSTAVIGIVTFLSGYALWLMDVHFCNLAKSYRHAIGLPLGLLLEGHAWWHILTGLGVYFYLVFLEHLRAHLMGVGDQYELVRIWGYLPRLDRVHKKTE